MSKVKKSINTVLIIVNEYLETISHELLHLITFHKSQTSFEELPSELLSNNFKKN